MDSNLDAQIDSTKSINAAASQPQDSRLLSPTVLSMQLSGLLLLACFWMPIAVGCDGKTKRCADTIRADSTALELSSQVILAAMTFGNGLAWGMILLVVALFRNKSLFRYCLFGQLVILGFTALVYSILFTMQELVTFVVLFLPMAVYLVMCVFRPLHQRNDLLAWARLQQASTIGTLVFLHICCALSQSILYGYFVAIVASLISFLAIEYVRLRIEHDLWDATVPAQRLQFSVKKMMIWSSFIALIIAYYQHADELIKLLSP